MHARVVITEAGATVDVPYLVLADTSEHATELAQRKMRSIIESVVKESQRRFDLGEQTIRKALQHGYWWADLGSEEFTVMIQEPEQIERPGSQIVTICVEGGTVSDVNAPGDIRVVICDYDIDGVDENRLSCDAKGRRCVRTVWHGKEFADQTPTDMAEDGLTAMNRFLNDGFVTLTLNPANDPGSMFEAWAYSGPLDFNKAAPVRFGLGSSPVNAVLALQQQLADTPDDSAA